MTKQQVSQRVLQNGKPLDMDKFEWNEKALVFSTTEENLIIDFGGIPNCTFNTGSNCTFNTGSDCTFNTGSNCTFNTGSDCTFNTGSNCTFNTVFNCTFNTVFNCTFNTGSDCTFNTYKNCVVVRRDIYEVIELNGKGRIKLNSYGVKGYTSIKDTHTISIDGKNIELSEESYQALKDSLV